MRIEIVVVRDPDAATEVSVYLDGKSLSDAPDGHVVDVVVVDPGAGHIVEDWILTRDEEAALASPAAARDIIDSYDSYLDSRWIEKD